MKRIISLVVSTLFLLTLFTSSVFAKDITDYNKDLDLNKFNGTVIMSAINDQIAFVNGKEIPGTKCIVKNSTTLVPLRFVSENFNCAVAWEKSEPTRITVYKSRNNTIILNIGKKEILVNGTTKAISVEPQIINNVTYLPLRAIGEALGKNITYDNTYKLIYIMESTVDTEIARTSFIMLPLAIAFGGNEDISVKRVLFGNTFITMFEDVNGKLYAWDINTANKPISLDDEFWGRWVTDSDDTRKYLIFHVGDCTMGSDYLLKENDDGTYSQVYATDMVDVIIRNGYAYIVEDNYPGVSMDTPFNPNYEGNLYRININNAVKVNGDNDNVSKEMLGQKGYLYGFTCYITNWFDTRQMVAQPNRIKIYEDTDIKITANSIKTIGIDITSKTADKGYGEYEISLDGSRNHTLIKKMTPTSK